ncbi:hypothetical protein [Fibrobacter sp.]|uniref:hypothetical protein n=1 Tax=Fibrobacter sp. TaxID=35828 RepID=UPI00388DFD79
MKKRIFLEDADFACKFTDNYQKYSDIGNISIIIKTILYQCTDQALIVIVKIIVMVLRNRE